MKKGWILLLISILFLGCDINRYSPDIPIDYGVLRIECPYVGEYTSVKVDIDITGNNVAISLSITKGQFKEYTLPVGSYTIIGVWKIWSSSTWPIEYPIDETIYLSTAGLTWTP